VPDLLCGPIFEDLPPEPANRDNLLLEAEESYRIFYKMVEEIMTLKE